jgi:hypothetical protein
MSRLTEWPAKDKSIKISEMELSHLYNTVRILHKYSKERSAKYKVNGYETVYNGRFIQEWIMDMNREIDRRNKVRFG